VGPPRDMERVVADDDGVDAAGAGGGGSGGGGTPIEVDRESARDEDRFTVPGAGCGVGWLLLVLLPVAAS